MNFNMREQSRTFMEVSQLEFAKRCRRISIKNIAAGVLNQDILELLKPYFYQQIHIDKNSLSCKAVLLDGSCAARCLEELNGKMFRGQRLSVSLASCDFMLCVTQLPLSFTHDQFLSLITPFGTPERCFLVHSDVTGQSKGYGCVEFTSKESSIKAKNQLNGFKIQNNVLQVHWLDTIPIHYTGLYSSCLLVEDLPPGFKDQQVLHEVFSQFSTPKFCQLAQCPYNDFAIVEYADSSQAEESWTKLNGYRIGEFPVKVSFCVPGPRGLVVLNALRASRDLIRGNPCGGLLPTPVMDHNTNKQLASSLLNHHKDSLNVIPDGLAAVTSKDPQVHQLLNALQNRLTEPQVLNPSLHNVHHTDIWAQSQLTMNSAMLNHLQHAGRLVGEVPTSLPYRATDGVSHHMSLRSRSGSISSCDSGAKAEDEVFEPMRRPSQEDSHPFENTYGLRGVNVEDKIDSTFVGKPILRNTGFGNTEPVMPHHSLLAHTGNNSHPNTLLFLREESQRSESADSAYSGSQGSNSSDYGFPCHANRVSNISQCATSNSNLPGHTTRTQGSSLVQEFHHFNSILPPGVQRYPQIPKKVCYDNVLDYTGSSGAVVTSSGRFSPYPTPGVTSKSQQQQQQVNQPISRELGSNEHMSAFVHCPQSNDVMRIPRPEINRKDVPTKVPVSVCTSTQPIGGERKFQTLSSLSAVLPHEVEKPTAIIGRTTPHTRRTRLTPIPGIGHELGADSPTQLQLLGSNLVEGLLGESPRSGGFNASTAGRLLRALNLFSPTEFVNSPQAVTPIRKRGVGNVLPSPEPSPEAGAYVGQHSQGLGGHYADSYGILGEVMGLGNSPQHPGMMGLMKRRRSNET
uniref:uncharacterized protein LOC100182699 isoform X1 n=1 Tax=Ciona intestinalis TaxID=7719 RepID=UPI0000523D00|nr:uncharacterized protein LOC100182699 isoform X1 [Ciona intestinalis]|eukprot:XP_002120230.1 uncharacterized protein LOC100182699 isoform X1 [Ciona intestinalis]